MRIVCCIVAAGQGTRLGAEWTGTPKALVPVLGRPMLYYSLHALDLIPDLTDFTIAAPPEFIPKFRDEIRAWGFSQPANVIAGGASRAESVLNTLRALAGNPPEMVLIHDAARVCITRAMIEALMQVVGDGVCATLAQSAVDTLRAVDNGMISGEIDRSTIACLETPQAFPYARLLELHESAKGSEELPDDTTLFTRAGEKVRVVFHDDYNMKITYPEDIAAAEGILFARGWQDASEGEE